MNKVIVSACIALAVLLAGVVALDRMDYEWSGVDERVVEHIAAQHGRSAREPFINTDKGDLFLFAFLVAGAAGGFVGGYLFRHLFPPAPVATEESGSDG